MSAPAIGERIARMERSGVIQRYGVVVDWGAAGFPVVTYLAITATQGLDLEPVMAAVSQLAEVETITVVTGELDLLARLRVRDVQHLRTVLFEKVRQISGVQRTETYLPIAEGAPKNFVFDLIQSPRAAARSGCDLNPSRRSRMSDTKDQGIGRRGFVEAHGLYSAEQEDAAERMVARISELDLRTIRITTVDQHGVPRGKFLSADAAIAGLRNGVDFSGAVYSLDSGNVVFPPAFVQGGGFGIPEFTGFPDIVVVPDPTTFHVLPWADRTGWVLCDGYFSTGTPVPLDGRRILRTQLERLGEAGYRYLAGLEVEFYIVQRQSAVIGLNETGAPPPPPSVNAFAHGYQFQSEVRLDGVNDTLTALRDVLFELDLPPRSMENEWGPGQMEFTFSPMEGLAAADAMVLFRSAVKQVCQRRGLLASFMCRPGLPNFFPSGWHLHESILDAGGTNVFASDSEDLSEVGRQYVAGVLEHACAMTVFSTPTINGFSRFQPYSFAPDRVAWAVENRGAMIRVQGGAGDPGTHLENRLGEPAANPYLYMAADLTAGLDGIRRQLTAPPPVDADPYAVENAQPLPTSLEAGIEALAADPLYREQFGDGFIDYFVMMKRAELARYQASLEAEPLAEGQLVSAWEMREYFEFF